MKEANILRKLQEADPTDKKHLIRLERTFDHRGHLCLVFENLRSVRPSSALHFALTLGTPDSMNLREVVKRFGKDVGINLRAVRAYASQMFLALSLMKKCDIMHADIKPDNILVRLSLHPVIGLELTLSLFFYRSTNPSRCSRFATSDPLPTCPKTTSRRTSAVAFTGLPKSVRFPFTHLRPFSDLFIFAVIGLPYDCSLDTWSIGCTLFELYTGKCVGSPLRQRIFFQ